MTPKEALENANLKGSKAYDVLLKALTELEELKRYPTSGEVCKALSEYYRRYMMDIYYDKKLNAFCYGEYGEYSIEVRVNKDGNLEINLFAKSIELIIFPLAYPG